MKNIIFIFSFILFAATARTQPISYFTISGKVIDATSGAPLQLASVFAQNSTLGTATDAEGNFKLRLPNGGYTLVITFTGYETILKRITSSDLAENTVDVALKQKDKAMEDVVIKSSSEVKDGLEKYGDFFLENFIGNTINSKACTIKNKEALKFYFSKKRNRLKVLASVPLEIENRSLGYKIKYALDSFTHDYSTQISTYTGSPLFEEIPSMDTVQKSTWGAKRLQAYKGSILHFMRSVYYKTLKEEGFEIQFIVKNNDLDTAIHLKNYYGAFNYIKDDSTQLVDINPNQRAVAVIYTKGVPDMDYSLQADDAPKKFQLSVITFANAQSLTIEQNGYYFDQNDITISGYWIWGKVADMVPYDFNPNL